jgi:hypothetical protein
MMTSAVDTQLTSMGAGSAAIDLVDRYFALVASMDAAPSLTRSGASKQSLCHRIQSRAAVLAKRVCVYADEIEEDFLRPTKQQGSAIDGGAYFPGFMT